MYKYQSKTDISKTSDEIISFLEGHLHTLKTPSVYLGREINTISKPWDEKKTRIILYMPVEYQAGVNNLGTAILYNRLNAKDDVICERGYMPENALRKKLVSKRYPTGFSLESKHQLKDFDCIGFSCYFELQFLNLIYTLYHSGVPLYSKERDNDNYPIVILGGVAAYSPAVVEDIVDMVFIGEGEEQMDLLAKKLADYKTGKYVDKRAFLLDCAITIPGCYVPQFYTVVYSDNGRGRWITSITPNAQLKGLSYPIIKACFDISSSTPFYKRILPETNGLHIGYNGIEIARGCYNSCRFCMASAIYKPYREYSIDKIITAIDDAINYFGCNEITPHSLNYSSYSERYRLIKKMSEKLRYISSASQRLDTFSPILAESLHDRGSKRATFAIEAGSQRMRDVVNKEITDQNIHDTLTTLIDLKYSSVKLYMISGLPFETPTDTLEIINILNPIVEHAKRRRTRFTIKLSYTQFTAKPFTALQWADVTEVLDPQPNTGWGNYKAIKSGLKNIGIWASRSLNRREHVVLQLLNRADRRFTQGLVRAVLEDNFTYPFASRNDKIIKYVRGESSDDRFIKFIEYLDKLCVSATGVNIKEFFKEIPVDKILPWDVLTTGVKKDWLIGEYIKAKQAAVTPSCMKCSNCGICDKDNDFPKILRPDSTHSKDIPEEELANLSDSVNTKLRGKLLVTLNIPPESRFTEPAVIKRLLILAFNSKGVFVDSVSLQSELLHFRGFMFGVEFAILKLRSDAKRLDFEENQNLYDTINRTLEGLVKVTDVVYSATSINDTLANVAKYAFYKLEVYSKIPQQLSKLLKAENEFKEFEQPGGRHRQRKNKKTYTLLRKQTNKKYKLYRGKKLRIVKQLSTGNKQIEKNKFCKFIPLIKAIPNQKSVTVYALVPMDVNVYYLIKELAGHKGVTELLRQPLERIVFISDYKSMYKCDCGRYIEITDNGVSVENQLLDTYDHLCVSCLIDKDLI